MNKCSQHNKIVIKKKEPPHQLVLSLPNRGKCPPSLLSFPCPSFLANSELGPFLSCRGKRMPGKREISFCLTGGMVVSSWWEASGVQALSKGIVMTTGLRWKETQSNLERQEQCCIVFSHNCPQGYPGWHLSRDNSLWLVHIHYTLVYVLTVRVLITHFPQL